MTVSVFSARSKVSLVVRVCSGSKTLATSNPPLRFARYLRRISRRWRPLAWSGPNYRCRVVTPAIRKNVWFKDRWSVALFLVSSLVCQPFFPNLVLFCFMTYLACFAIVVVTCGLVFFQFVFQRHLKNVFGSDPRICQGVFIVEAGFRSPEVFFCFFTLVDQGLSLKIK